MSSRPGIHPKSIKAIGNSINTQKSDLNPKRLPNPNKRPIRAKSLKLLSN